MSKIPFAEIYEVLPQSLSVDEVTGLICWIAGCYWQERPANEVATFMLRAAYLYTQAAEGPHHATH